MDMAPLGPIRLSARAEHSLVSSVQLSSLEALQERSLGHVISQERLYKSKRFPYRIQPLVRFRFRNNRADRGLHRSSLGETGEVVDLPMSPRFKTVSELKKAGMHSARGGGGFLFTPSKTYLPPINLRVLH